jgi:hypothetical protein
MRFILGIVYLVLVIWAIYDLWMSNRSTEQKIIWMIVIIFFPVGGSVIYYLLSRNILKF